MGGSATVSQAALRSDLIGAVFRECDADKDGFLNEKEMRVFAVHTGFDGSEEEWASEFRLLCDEQSAKGVNATLFEKLADDTSDGGCYCSDEELRDMLDKLRCDAKEVTTDVKNPMDVDTPKGTESLQEFVDDAPGIADALKGAESPKEFVEDAPDTTMTSADVLADGAQK